MLDIDVPRYFNLDLLGDTDLTEQQMGKESAIVKTAKSILGPRLNLTENELHYE